MLRLKNLYPNNHSVLCRDDVLKMIVVEGGIHSKKDTSWVLFIGNKKDFDFKLLIEELKKDFPFSSQEDIGFSLVSNCESEPNFNGYLVVSLRSVGFPYDDITDVPDDYTVTNTRLDFNFL